ncbi:hypothetical protein [Siminovitchia terrae]|uniref:hypothetical protein n=1 Tax=Siminovitchia terrae TaxID=1914933 RepID=UPI0028AC41A5|nr:hypothetical protein [Siminovitchia terrae]
MEVIYEILYKNGKEDVITQRFDEDDIIDIKETNEFIKKCIRDEGIGVLTIGDGKATENMVRMTDVSRVKVRIQED